MLDRITLQVLLQGLTLLMLGPTYEASSLGLTVHVVPLDSDGGNTVWAHFTVIAPSPCPPLSGLCAPGEDCLVYDTPLPLTGTKPCNWCVRQWQKTVPSNYSATISLGSNTEHVSVNAGPKIRAKSGRLNRPAFAALPPPLRARVNCSQLFSLSVKDLDGDIVRCRFASFDKGECVNCTQYSFIEVDEEKCILSFTGKAPTGQYFIYLMVEDWMPLPSIDYVTDSPLSSVPVHLSLTVEESAFTCSDVPVAIDRTPKQDSVVFVLPYQEEKINLDYSSEQESVVELAVVGPPGLSRTGFTSADRLASMAVSWIGSENNRAHLLPICFIANTKSLQSEPRCMWLYQRETTALPAGTELKCGMTEMILVLPITSLTNINLAQLQLNSPNCSVTYNNTHLIANISKNGCGTKTVYYGSELVYTNTLRTVNPYTLIIRQPSLILPLACRIPSTQVNNSKFNITMPTERKAFGEFRVWIEVYLPGTGPLASFTKTPQFRSNFRVRRDTNSGTGSDSTNSISTSEKSGTKLSQLDVYVRSNTTVAQAKMMVNNCTESETGDFETGQDIVKDGCITTNSTFEIITDQNNTRIYRLNLNSIEAKGTMFYIQCTVNLCISTVASQSCPDLCSGSQNQSIVVRDVFSNTYTVKSGPISLMVTPAPPVTTTTPTTTTPANPTSNTTTQNPPTVITTANTTSVPTVTTTTPTTTTPANPTSNTTTQNPPTVITTANTASVPMTTTVAATADIAGGQTTTSSAPEQASSLAAGVILTTFSIFLQKPVFY